MSLLDAVEPGTNDSSAARRPFRPAFPLLSAAALLVIGLIAAGTIGCGGPAFTLVAADGGSEDGGGALDAGTADADAGSFCAMSDAYDFCADFDESPVSAEWNSGQSLTGGATGAEDNAAFVSAPNSYLAISPPLAAADASTQPTAHAVVTQSSLPKGQTHIAFDLRIDELDFPNAGDPNASVVAMAYVQGDYAVLLVFHPAANPAVDGPFAAELVEATTMVGSTTPTLKATALSKLLTSVGLWYSVTLDFTIDTASLTVPASFGVTSGSPTPTTSTQPVTLSPPLGTAAALTRTLAVGVEATAAVGEAKIRFDNVTYHH